MPAELPQSPDDSSSVRPAPLVLSYSNRPPPPRRADPNVRNFCHFAVAVFAYAGALAAVRLASLEFGWDVGSICGAWTVLIAITLAIAAWLAGKFGWPGFFAGAMAAIIGSLWASAWIVGI